MTQKLWQRNCITRPPDRHSTSLPMRKWVNMQIDYRRADTLLDTWLVDIWIACSARPMRTWQVYLRTGRYPSTDGRSAATINVGKYSQAHFMWVLHMGVIAGNAQPHGSF